MRNRTLIINALILSIEEDMRNDCIKGKITSKKRIEEIIQLSKSKIEQSAEFIIQDYENQLMKKISDELVINIKESLHQNKLSINDLVNDLISTVNQNHSSLSKDVYCISDLQRKIRMQILEEEIKTIQLDISILRRHQATLDKIAKKEAGKVSWAFVLITLASLLLWTFLISKYKWDNMEKWTFISGGVLVVFYAVYFAIYGRNFTSENLKQKKFESIKSQNYSLHKFDTGFLQLTENLLENKKSELMKLSNH